MKREKKRGTLQTFGWRRDAGLLLSEQHAITRDKQAARKKAVDAYANEVHLSQMYEVFLQLGIT